MADWTTPANTNNKRATTKTITSTGRNDELLALNIATGNYRVTCFMMESKQKRRNRLIKKRCTVT